MHTHTYARTRTCTGAASQLQTKRPQHIFLPSPLPSPVPASLARFPCKCSCFVFAPSALANPLDYVACLPFFRYFFIWFHFISFFSFAAYLLDLPICGVLICYPVAAPFCCSPPPPRALHIFPYPVRGHGVGLLPAAGAVAGSIACIARPQTLWPRRKMSHLKRWDFWRLATATASAFIK